MAIAWCGPRRQPPVSWRCLPSRSHASAWPRAVFVIDRNDRIVYAEYVADQLCEPEYGAALEAVQQAAMEKLPG